MRDMHKWFIRYGNELPLKDGVVYLRKNQAFSIAQEYSKRFVYVLIYKRTYDEHSVCVASILNGVKLGKEWGTEEYTAVLAN